MLFLLVFLTFTYLFFSDDHILLKYRKLFLLKSCKFIAHKIDLRVETSLLVKVKLLFLKFFLYFQLN